MSDNLWLWEQVRKVPEIAKKPIGGGRLKGKTDINPVWRIMELTKHFGICGIGWYPKITRSWIESDDITKEQSAFVEIEFYIKDPTTGFWSMPISATGGAAFVTKEKEGWYQSDECFKMAYTDAISVACKLLGVGADVYWSDGTKYNKKPEKVADVEPKPADKVADKPVADTDVISTAQAKRMFALAGGNEAIVRAAIEAVGYLHSKDVKKSDYDAICKAIQDGTSTKQTMPPYIHPVDKLKALAFTKGITEDMLRVYADKKYKKPLIKLLQSEDAELAAYLNTLPDKE
jgi:hypothetical protein